MVVNLIIWLSFQSILISFGLNAILKVGFVIRWAEISPSGAY
jgi:hypothetical protein